MIPNTSEVTPAVPRIAPGTSRPRFRSSRDSGTIKVNLTHGGIARVDVMTDDYLERELSQEPEAYAGVSEVAKLLGVSRQRVFELRTRGDFPAPVADLAAGPVWRLSTLKRFISEWPRKPGRPRKNPGV